MNKELFDWLNNKELTILKFTSIKFIVNNVNDVAAFEHMKNQLNNCKNDNEYAKLVMSSSNLNECFEK